MKKYSCLIVLSCLALTKSFAATLEGSLLDPSGENMGKNTTVYVDGKSDMADSFGVWRISNIAQGEHVVNIKKDGVLLYHAITTIDKEKMVNDINFESAVSGIVLDSKGNPVSNVTVAIGGKEYSKSDFTDQEGTFKIRHALLGNQIYSVKKDGKVLLSGTVFITGPKFTKHFVLPAGKYSHETLVNDSSRSKKDFKPEMEKSEKAGVVAPTLPGMFPEIGSFAK